MIEPYYEQDGITIYNADCEQVLPQLGRFDLLLTDPPYGMNFRSNHRIEKHAKIQGDDSMPVGVLQRLIHETACASYIFCRWDNLHEMPRPKSVIAWVKNNWSMGDLKHEHGRQWEAICFYAGQQHRFHKRIPDVIVCDRTGNDLHPTEKPVKLIGTLIACNTGQTILDPFMGSGTTLLAAKLEGRQAVGIEISRDYCDIAIERLKQKVLF